MNDKIDVSNSSDWNDILGDMNRRNKSFLRPLLLLLILVVGPLQAQTVFACLTMDMVMNNANNCKTNQDCVYMDFDDVLDLNQSPCFEQTIVLSINQDIQQNIPIINSVVESDVDLRAKAMTRIRSRRCDARMAQWNDPALACVTGR